MVSDAIGEQRSRLVYRLLVLLYFATLGTFVVIPLLTILAGVFFIIDAITVVIWNRSARFGRTVGTAGLRHHWQLLTYAVAGSRFPGMLPSADHAITAS